MTGGTRGPLHADSFPRLAEFAAGYLHEDFTLEHGTPENALSAFLDEASAEERDALIEELRRFHEAAKSASWVEVRDAFAALGGAWRPRSRAALDALFALPARRAAQKKRGLE